MPEVEAVGERPGPRLPRRPRCDTPRRRRGARRARDPRAHQYGLPPDRDARCPARARGRRRITAASPSPGRSHVRPLHLAVVMTEQILARAPVPARRAAVSTAPRRSGCVAIGSGAAPPAAARRAGRCTRRPAVIASTRAIDHDLVLPAARGTAARCVGAADHARRPRPHRRDPSANSRLVEVAGLRARTTRAAPSSSAPGSRRTAAPRAAAARGTR